MSMWITDGNHLTGVVRHISQFLIDEGVSQNGVTVAVVIPGHVDGVCRDRNDL